MSETGPLILGTRAPSPAQRAEHAEILTSSDYFEKIVFALRTHAGEGARVPSIKSCPNLKLTPAAAQYQLDSTPCRY